MMYIEQSKDCGEQDQQMKLMVSHEFLRQSTRPLIEVIVWNRQACDNANVFSLMPSPKERDRRKKKLILVLYEIHPMLFPKNG